MTSARPPNAASGSPPPTILPSTVRSGVTPNRSCAPPRATRKPVITSSKTSSAPARVAEQAQRLEEPGRRRHAAHVPGDGLDDDRRQALAVALDRRGDAVDVVVLARRSCRR